jgi:hypothetical protein
MVPDDVEADKEYYRYKQNYSKKQKPFAFPDARFRIFYYRIRHQDAFQYYCQQYTRGCTVHKIDPQVC